MNITRKKLLIGVLVGVIAGALMVQFIGKPVFVTWLRAHSTVWSLHSPAGSSHAVAIYRYPKLRHIPDYFGFGQGYVQLFDKITGHVWEEKVTHDLGAIHLFAWGPTSVDISGFAQWELPEGYQPPQAVK
jgi:hypothetical protein